MNKERESRQKQLNIFDYETQKYIMYMCKKGCNFYKNGCTKRRLIKECAKMGLKNKE